MTEREAFEAWCKSKGAPKENWWVRQLDDGGYSCEPVDKAWEAWQARAQTAQAVPMPGDQIFRIARRLAPKPIDGMVYVPEWIVSLVRAVEESHGIVGEKGGT